MSFSIDPTTTQRLKGVYPDLRVRVIRVYNDFWNLHQLALRCCQGRRTYADQQAIFEKGRHLVNGEWVPVDPVHHAGVVTWAKPGDSWHHFSAIDSDFAGADPFLEQLEKKDPKRFEFLWSEYGRLGKAHGLVWGGDWEPAKRDRPHLELTYGLTLKEVKQIYAFGGLRGVWSKFDQIRGVTVGSEWKISPEGIVLSG